MLKLNILTPKGMSLAQKIASHQFWCQCVHRCDLWARRRNQKKTNKKNWLFAQTTHVVGSKSNFARG